LYGVIDIGPLSSSGTTSYRLPIVTIGLSLTVFAVLRMFQTDRQTDGIGLAIGGTAAVALCTKVHRPPETAINDIPHGGGNKGTVAKCSGMARSSAINLLHANLLLSVPARPKELRQSVSIR